MAVGTVKLLLDGQQRITTLYGIIRGKPPLFFEGNAQAFTNLYFHLADEAFEFYAPLKMNGNPMWISVSELMRQGIGHGLPAGEFHYELADPATGERLAIIDLAWPEGLQQQYSSPVAVLIDEDGTTEEIVNGAGFRFFTDADTFRAYLEREILALDVVPQ